MTYAEKMTMKIMGEMSYNYGNQPATLKIVNQIIADTKRACSIAVTHSLSFHPNSGDRCMEAIRRAEVREDKK